MNPKVCKIRKTKNLINVAFSFHDTSPNVDNMSYLETETYSSDCLGGSSFVNISLLRKILFPSYLTI